MQNGPGGQKVNPGSNCRVGLEDAMPRGDFPIKLSREKLWLGKTWSKLVNSTRNIQSGFLSKALSKFCIHYIKCDQHDEKKKIKVSKF